MMNMRFQLWICTVLLATLPLQHTLAQDMASSYGSEFYIGFMRNFRGSLLAKLQLTIGTPAAGIVSYKVEDSQGELDSGTVTSNAPVSISIPDNKNILQVTDIQFQNRNKGIHVSTENDLDLYVVVENSIFFVNHGTYLAYPCLSLGDDVDQYEYVALSVDDPDDAKTSQFLLVGCEDDTTISISPTQTILLPMDLQRDSELVTIQSGMTSHEVTLNEMQTLLVQSTDDLTGTKIVSNKPLTVISGHECANIPPSSSGCEPLAVQVPPTATWGNTFLLAPFTGRDSLQAFKAVTSSETTNFVYTCGSTAESRGAIDAKTLDFFTSDYCYLQAEDPIFVTQLSFGGSIDRKGDPTISMISPIDQYIKTIDFLSLPSSLFSLNYISITVTTEHHSPESIRLDGHTINCEWQAISDSEENVVGYGCSKIVSSSTNSPRRHTVSHADDNGLFSVLVYGFNGFPSLGYSYLAGQTLQILEGGDINIDVELNFLPFLDLITYPGSMELDNTQPDSTSEPITIPNRLIIGDKIATQAYVNENGIISFNKPWKFSLPDKFPPRNFWTRSGMAVAPFWSDNDIRKNGTVRYATFHLDDAAANLKGKNWLDQVNKYIQSTQKEGEKKFVGTWLLTAHWENVHPSPHGDEDHKGISEEELEKTNNYQATIVTDVIRTYAVFSYKCGEIQWSSLGNNRAAVVGYNAEGNYYENHPLSGIPEIGNFISCKSSFTIGKRRKRQVGNETDEHFDDELEAGSTSTDSITSNIVHNVGTSIELTSEVEQCMAAVTLDKLFYASKDFISPETLAQLLDPCPCTIQQIENDLARFIQFGDNNCYISAQPTILTADAIGPITPTQMCCYTNEGALQVSPNEGFAGTFLLYHPTVDQMGYDQFDYGFRNACCNIGFDDDNSFCSDYFKRRIINTCQSPTEQYRPPAFGCGWGEPHYKTFDGLFYDFHDAGEYILLNILPEDLDTTCPIFSLQGQLEEWNPPSGGYYHRGFAFGYPQLSFEHDSEFRVFQTRPGPSVEITQLQHEEMSWTDATGKVQLKRMEGNITVALFFELGIKLKMRPNFYCDSILDFEVFVPRKYGHNRIQGLLGNLDGNHSNEFHTRENIPVPINYRNNSFQDPQIVSHLNDTWKLNEQDIDKRLFRPNHDQRRRRQADDNFIPMFLDELEITDDVRMVCEGSPQCMIDLIITGDRMLAMGSLMFEKSAEALEAEINNYPPNISANAIFNVTVGQESSYNIVVDDPGDEFTLMVLGGLPPNSALEPLGGGKYEFRWNLQEVITKPLTFIATDSMNASSTFVPIVEICACVNGGSCSREGLLSSNATVVLNCRCTEAFSGTFCEEDRNGCSEIQCFEGVECMDIPAPGVGAVCGSCPVGYTGDTSKCYDIDECQLNSTLCEQKCENTDGSFFCACDEGYQLINDHLCQDVNECEGINDCHQLCENTLGSYTCSCSDGFTLHDDGRTCIANVPCEGPCSHGCAVVNGEEQCYCPIGFELQIPGRTQCVDINECDINPCHQVCINTESSFQCGCHQGYRLQENGRTCIDFDDCFDAVQNEEALCKDENSGCQTTEGTYQCVCVPGYELVGGHCSRIINEPPPPPPPSLTPTLGVENSVVYTATKLTPISFTPALQQKFREVTAGAINQFCEENPCTVVLLDRETKLLSDYKVDPIHVAIPTSLINQNDNGELMITLYIQLVDGFVSREDLQLVLEQSEEQYTEVGFLLPRPVYFEFRDQRIPNYGQVPLALVGTVHEDNVLFCKTNNEDCCGLPNRRGEFYYPNGTQVPIRDKGSGFYRGRYDDKSIRLSKRSDVTSPTGTFRCWLPDANDKWHSVYINLV